MEARSVAEKLRELELLELKRSSGGELNCCYQCFQNMEEYQRVQDRCAELHELVRADFADARHGPDKKRALEKAAKEARGGREMARAEGHRRPRSASPGARAISRSPSRPLSSHMGKTEAVKATLSVSASANFADGLRLRDIKRDPVVLEAAAARALISSVKSLYRRDIDGLYKSTLDEGNPKPLPKPTADLLPAKRERQSLRWTDIPRKATQWRFLIAVHFISAATLPASHPLHGKVGCVSYSLGQSVSTLPFVNRQRGGEFARNPLIMVQQMRVHYMLGTLAVCYVARLVPYAVSCPPRLRFVLRLVNIFCVNIPVEFEEHALTQPALYPSAGR